MVSLISRVTRTTELRVDHIEFDHAAREFIEASLAFDGGLNMIANKRQAGDVADYAAKEAEERGMNPVPGRADVLFLEVEIDDPSDFSDILCVRGATEGPYRILRVASPAAPNAIAAILLALRDATGVLPRAFFEWSEGSPVAHLLRYLLVGRGDTPSVVREIIRKVEPDPARAPASTSAEGRPALPRCRSGHRAGCALGLRSLWLGAVL